MSSAAFCPHLTTLSHAICLKTAPGLRTACTIKNTFLEGQVRGCFAGGRVVASPYARRLAADAGVNISQATGSGPGGRIVAQDVQQLIDSGSGEAPAAEASAPSGTTDVSPHDHSSPISACPVPGTGGAAAN